LRILVVYIIVIFWLVALDPWREMEQSEGMHGREMGSFLLVVKDEGEESWKL
jgi:hypothetical protein